MVPPIMSVVFKVSALMVSLQPDGSALLVHGGIEMGQGLHTKLQQICAQGLGIPVEKVFTPPQGTFSTPFSPGTGGSFGTDINGPPIVDCCKQLLKRLEPFMSKGESVAQAVGVASKMGVDLVAFAKFQFPPWGWTNPFVDHNFLYFTWNGVVSEAEINVLTGENRIIRADIVQDVGRSLNPTIDIGQVEGGFVQGLSFLTLEDLESTYSSNGQLDLTTESFEWSGIKNMPIDFHVSLYKGFNSHNPNAPYGSKGIGEPPYCMGIGGPLAIRAAIAEARKDNGLDPWVNISYPLTVDKVALACGTKL